MGKYSQFRPVIRDIIENSIDKDNFMQVMSQLWDVVEKEVKESKKNIEDTEVVEDEKVDAKKDSLEDYHDDSAPVEVKEKMEIPEEFYDGDKEEEKPTGLFAFKDDENAPPQEHPFERIERRLKEMEEKKLDEFQNETRIDLSKEFEIKPRLQRLGSKQSTIDSPPSFEMVEKSKLIMRELPAKLAKPIIEEGHYSHYMPQSYLCLGFYYEEWLATVIVYGPPVGRNVAGSVFEGGTERNVWELVRLFSYDWAGKNSESRAIGLSIKYIKKHHPEVVALVSYADPYEGHQGGIYKATNWRFEGRFDYSYPIILVDGKQRHPRGLYSEFGSCGIDFLREKLGDRLKLSERKTAKLRFTYALHKDVKFNKPALPYLKKLSKQVGTKYEDSSYGALAQSDDSSTVECPPNQEEDSGSIPTSSHIDNEFVEQVKELVEENKDIELALSKVGNEQTSVCDVTDSISGVQPEGSGSNPTQTHSSLSKEEPKKKKGWGVREWTGE